MPRALIVPVVVSVCAGFLFGFVLATRLGERRLQTHWELQHVGHGVAVPCTSTLQP